MTLTTPPVSNKGVPIEANWVSIGRGPIVIGLGETAAQVAPSHSDWAYFGGFLLGFILELLVFPKLTWKKNLIVLLIVLIAGTVRVFVFKSTSP